MPTHQPIHFVELAAWMRENKESFRSLSDKTGIDKMTLNRLVNGTLKRFSPDLFAKISRATKSKVGEPELIAHFVRVAAADSSQKRRAA